MGRDHHSDDDEPNIPTRFLPCQIKSVFKRDEVYEKLQREKSKEKKEQKKRPKEEENWEKWYGNVKRKRKMES
jgi:hypothetical protein